MSKSKAIDYKCSCNKREFFPAKVRSVVNGFERITTFRTGYVCETPITEGRSHGKHGMELIFVLKGELGAIELLIYTGWMPNHDRFEESPVNVVAADIGRHRLNKKYDHETAREGCVWLNNKPCYYDGSGLQADKVFKIFTSKGEEAMWAELESYYKSWIES